MWWSTPKEKTASKVLSQGHGVAHAEADPVTEFGRKGLPRAPYLLLVNIQRHDPGCVKLAGDDCRPHAPSAANLETQGVVSAESHALQNGGLDEALLEGAEGAVGDEPLQKIELHNLTS
jgi:hypothetical protein